MADFPEIPEPSRLAGQESSDRFGRWIAAAIVLTTLAAALVAFLQATALRTDDEAAVRAERLAAQSLGEQVRAREAVDLQVERFELAERQRARAGAARQERFFAVNPGRDRELRLEERRWLDVASATERTSRAIARFADVEPLTLGGKTGPVSDLAFPNTYLSASRRDATRLSALRDGANEEGDRAEEQFTGYAVSLTMLAVAVFLFGYSLTPHGRPRRKLFSGVAATFVAVATVWAAVTALDPPDRPPDEAATQFADARLAADVRDYTRAIRHYTRAIELRPSFADAYIGRAAARQSASTSVLPATIVGATRPEDLDRSISDLRRARELGSSDPEAVGRLAGALLQRGILRHDHASLEDSVDLFRTEQRNARGDNPGSYYGEAVALLALERYEEARKVYGEAIERTIYIDRKRKIKRADVGREQIEVSIALTDLELVRRAFGGGSARERNDSELSKQADRAKERIVGTLGALQPPSFSAGTRPPPQSERAQAAIELGQVRYLVDDAEAQFIIESVRGFDPERDRVSAQWYYEAPKLGWIALDQISGPLVGNADLDSEGNYFARLSYLGLTTPPSCLPGGRYRAEVYVNGRLAHASEPRAKHDLLQATPLREIGVAFCRPEDWRPSPKRLPGLIDGYTSDDGSAGAYAISVSPQVVRGGGSASERSEALIKQALKRFASLFPKPPSGKLGESVQPVFMGLEGETTREVAYPGGRAIIGAGATPGGGLIVGIVFGSDADFETPDPARVFASFSRF